LVTVNFVVPTILLVEATAVPEELQDFRMSRSLTQSIPFSTVRKTIIQTWTEFCVRIKLARLSCIPLSFCLMQINYCDNWRRQFPHWEVVFQFFYCDPSCSDLFTVAWYLDGT